MSINLNQLNTKFFGVLDKDVVDLSNKIDVPHTTIRNRAQIPDLANDLSVNYGRKRILAGNIVKVNNEFGPNGEPIYKVGGDTFDQIRLAGYWKEDSDTTGSYMYPSRDNDFMEITFYGTGLNILMVAAGPARLLRPTIDGGAEGADITVAYNSSLNGRAQSTNQIVKVASGLSLGLHTIKLRRDSSGNNTYMYGFEVICDTTTLKVNPGISYRDGKSFSLASQVDVAVKSSFDSGTLGTKGGHVLVYQKVDGTIGKAVTPTDVSALYHSSADHTNEEMIQHYPWREFGEGRGTSTDFSFEYNGSLSSYYYNLSDGSTTLWGSNLVSNGVGHYSGENVLALTSGSRYIVLSFTGTGVDADLEPNNDGDGTTYYKLYIDGVVQGANQYLNTRAIKKLVSGLPFGTHIVKIEYTSPGVASMGFHGFYVYGPKEPVLPANCSKLSSYYINADYSFDSNTFPSVDNFNISTGVNYKDASREITLRDGATGWTYGYDTHYDMGGAFVDAGSGGNAGNKIEYYFFGSGIEIYTRAQSNSGKWNLYIDDTLFTTGGSGNFPSASSNDTSGKFNSTTGEMDLYNAADIYGHRTALYGLTEGFHKLTIEGNGKNASSTNYYIVLAGLAIITSTYSLDKYTLRLTDQYYKDGSIKDLREVADAPTYPNVIRKTANLNAPSTSSTNRIPVPNCHCVIETQNGSDLEIDFEAVVRNNTTTGGIFIRILINGVQYGREYYTQEGGIGLDRNVSLKELVKNVPAGKHHIAVFYGAGSGTIVLNGLDRKLVVKEIKK